MILALSVFVIIAAVVGAQYRTQLVDLRQAHADLGRLYDRMLKTSRLETSTAQALRARIKALEEDRVRILEAKGVSLEFHLVANASRLEILETQDDLKYHARTRGLAVVKTYTVPFQRYGIASEVPIPSGQLGKMLGEAILADMKVVRGE